MADVSADGEMVRLSDGAALWVVTDNEHRHDLSGLVFLHGGAGMWDYLEPVAGLARDSYRTHRYDQRGCGRSSTPTRPGSACASPMPRANGWST
ncbi:alpha/beta fold hydrolase [Pseudonocardia phyllosphaerae]|uniref:alpha/beta fold hydrolase n=1 Tax=Pseudonocardia phyllosphaerae TaxID=3390502 RepID=UPI00397CFC17